jgi:hypothetical protein
MSTSENNVTVPSSTEPQVQEKKQGTKRPSKKTPGKKEKKEAGSKPESSIPLGSIPVPPPMTSPAKKASVPTSTAVPITGWGDANFTAMHKRVPLLEHEPDASGYFDLVDAVYRDLVARHTFMKFIPQSLFRYHCGQLWWYRVLFVHKSNGFILDSAHKRFLDTLSGLEDLVVPDKIAQYLANLGNFDFNGEVYRMKLPELHFDAMLNANVGKDTVQIPGSLRDVTARTDSQNFWRFAQFPIPAVLVTTIRNELYSNAQPSTKNRVLPNVHPNNLYGAIARPTENLVGFQLDGWSASHSSWASTFANLGWTTSSLPRDTQTEFQCSPGTLSWMSERLAQLPSEKMHSTKQLVLSKQGNFSQIGFLDTHTHDLKIHREFASARDFNLYRYTTRQMFHLSARSSLPPSLISATYCFGYRFRKYVFSGRYTNASPWMYTKPDSLDLLELPDGYINEINRSLDALDTDLTAARFQTYAQDRSTVLVSALI